MRFLPSRFFCLVLIPVVFMSAPWGRPAHADYFVWRDPHTETRLTFPDTWRRINNQKPDDLLTILGPSAQVRPVCRLRARHDARFTGYPSPYASDIQHAEYSTTFWNDYTGEYDNVQMFDMQDNAGLGRAFASLAVYAFTDAVAKSGQVRTGQSFAGVYFDTAYIFDCSVAAYAFKDWQPDFVSIAKSIQMRGITSATPNGYYPFRAAFRMPRTLRPVNAVGIAAPQ